MLMLTAALAAQAQVPLTVDTAFRFYYTPQVLEMGDTLGFGQWTPSVIDVVQRLDGRAMIVGSSLMPVDQIPWGTRKAVVLNNDGSPHQFIGNLGGKLIEIPSTNQYFISSGRRINYDGSLDLSYTFDVTDYALPSPWATGGYHVLEDRSVLISGLFRLRDNPNEYPLAKADQWGHRDTTFVMREITGYPNRKGLQLFPLRGGGYLLNGQNWTHYGGHPVGALIRLADDGSLDTTFTYPSPVSKISVVLEQEDGKYIVGGYIFLPGSPDTLHVARLNPDGSPDPTFNHYTDYRWGDFPHNAVLATIQSIVPLDPGRLFVGGTFTRIDGQPRNGIACIDTAGNLLDCWAGGGLITPPLGPVGSTPLARASLKCLPNGDCYLYGFYRGLIDANGLHPEQAYISRLHMPGTTGVAEQPTAPHAARAWPNPGTGTISLHWPGHATATLDIRDALGRQPMERQQLHAPFQADLQDLPPGIYHLLLAAPTGERTVVKWVKE